MKNILRRLHLSGGSHDDHSLSKTRHRHSFSDASSSPPYLESRALSSLSGWLSVAKHSLHQSGSPKHKKDDGSNSKYPPGEQAEREALQLAGDQALFLQDEELQVQVALALSARDDPEATAIETAKDFTRGFDSSPSNSKAEVLAYRYWKYNALNYDDKVVNGFYDVYGVASDLSLEVMPALVDLQETPVSDSITWEVILVNRAIDTDLVDLEQKVISAVVDSKAAGERKSVLARKIAQVVAGQMGGPVIDEGLLHRRWRTSSKVLKVSLGNVVLPLGRLQIGLGRHRALLFKVLADAVGIPCQLVKGKGYMGTDEGAVNIIKVDGREFIMDLMGAPGTLLPSDLAGIPTSSSDLITDQEDPIPAVMVTSGSEMQKATSTKDFASDLITDKVPHGLSDTKPVQRAQGEAACPEFTEVYALPVRPSTVRTLSHWRSPSWTEGISSPAARDMKVNDVSQYMMDAAKENPKLAQKLHDVLVESGVQAPLDLFSDISPKQLQAQINQERMVSVERQAGKAMKGATIRRKEKSSIGPGRPPAPLPCQGSTSSADGLKERLNRLNSVEGLGERPPLDPSLLNLSPGSSPNSLASSGSAIVQSAGPLLPLSAGVGLQENMPPEIIKHVPVAAAAAATAAVVASSMVAAAAKLEIVSEPTLEVPVAAAATATAAVVVATSAVIGRRLEFPLLEPLKENESVKGGLEDSNQRLREAELYTKDTGQVSKEGEGSGGAKKHAAEEDRGLDKSTGSLSAKSDKVLEDVAEWEIPWEELVVGERIGLGSYGEVYHGVWHGTEVAVKKFLDQDISGDALKEFRREVQLMKRMRHPNVVLFMGAVMRAPNLSIVTEILPRGSLYRLIHRSNNQLDERRRMRMALDVARGMNYLHNSTPVIVHRDLKSSNLLVDKNWVVKVCDFGLSRKKHSTFLSSKSTAGTPEWMAPEVLRNEPSNEKCDVYSFGVILWELATLQQPWAGMNPMQVVGAVGFQQRTLDIPDNMDPAIVRIIQQCWQSDPAARPSFADIMAALKPLQKPITQVSSFHYPYFDNFSVVSGEATENSLFTNGLMKVCSSYLSLVAMTCCTSELIELPGLSYNFWFSEEKLPYGCCTLSQRV
ncbi:hypothetical protein GOP47_0013745 [Adiantum capillus-veneris]|uniref:non-specific serine/threonine protein kinase n=1 Tax=Adiantum capillus-veneris TaxID=13818 RepID=A0A9D4UP39_ADICA|nr:hypothetical protein GOP47_0013745 [Adiantum capillus-veneris]